MVDCRQYTELRCGKTFAGLVSHLCNPDLGAKMSFAAVEKQDLVTMVSDEIARAIIEGEFQPGSRLNEVQLARQFEISRAPLREALRRLESRGLVQSHPRRGFFLRELTSEGMQELFEVRFSLEITAGRKVARSITDQMHKQLTAQFEEMCEAARNEDYARMTICDFGFHRLVCELSGNVRLLQIFDQISHEIRFCMSHLKDIHSDCVALANSHVPLLEALANGSEDGYEAALALHLEDARDKLLVALSRAEEEKRESPKK